MVADAETRAGTGSFTWSPLKCWTYIYIFFVDFLHVEDTFPVPVKKTPPADFNAGCLLSSSRCGTHLVGVAAQNVSSHSFTGENRESEGHLSEKPGRVASRWHCEISKEEARTGAPR